MTYDQKIEFLESIRYAVTEGRELDYVADAFDQYLEEIESDLFMLASLRDEE